MAPLQVGCSLLFVYDAAHSTTPAELSAVPPRIRMIDFAKVVPLEAGRKLTHRSTWVKGNWEDGFLVGLDALIQLWAEPLEALCGEDDVSRSESSLAPVTPESSLVPATPERSLVPATPEGSLATATPESSLATAKPEGSLQVPPTPESSLVPRAAPPPTPQSSSAADQR